MKKLFIMMLALTLVAAVPAIANDLISVDGVLTRKDIPFSSSYPDNPELSGVSPTTGFSWQGVYAPVIMVLDNAPDAYPHWGVQNADIFYQMPNAGKGATKLLAMFSDHMPEAAGGSRSARTPFVDVARGWGAAFAYAGYPGVDDSSKASVPGKLRAGKMSRDVLSFTLLGNAYSQRIKGYNSPHNLSADLLKIQETALKNGAQFVQKPFLFTDELPQSGDDARYFEVRHFGETAQKGDGNPASYSTFSYDEGKNGYIRTNSSGPYVDRDAVGSPIIFSNVIIQRVQFSYSEGFVQMNYLEGTGAADIFTGGKYIPGGWYRDTLDSRTVFVDETGSEIQMQRGKTFIVMSNDTTTVSYAPAKP
ncbi:MAG: DUF3048 domain-containing protein [Clostridiales bacterium]|nr:DUF3048 domain-containing protein [Clostridiales bacterium]